MRSALFKSIAIVVTIATWPVPSPGGEPDKNKLVVCALPAGMPRTGRAQDQSPKGLDLAVAQLVSRQLERELEVHWCASAACSWNCLPERRCDVVLGLPHGSGPAKEVAWSVPYAGSQFGLVVSKATATVRSLSDLRGQRVGIVAGTIAPSEKDHVVVRFKTREEVLDRFQSERLDAAFVDFDFAGWYLHTHPRLELRPVPEYVPREHWNMAMAVRAEDSELLVAINRSLSQIAESGQIEQIYRDHGVAFRPPFTRTARRTIASGTWKRIQERQEIVVAMDPANLPYSGAKEDKPGFDVGLARALAEQLGVKLTIDWIDVQRETAIGELLDRACDLAFGAAIDPGAVDDEEELTGKVIYSRPYYGTGYLLVRRKNGPQVQSLTDLQGEKSKRLGTEAGSVADYRLRQRGYRRRLFRNQLSVLKSLNDGHIDGAYLWANVGWTLHTTPEVKVELVPGFVPQDHWNIAIAMRRGDQALKQHVDAAVQELVDNRVVARALAKYHVPYFPPFENQAPKAKPPILRPATDRGLEPQTYRRQRSKKSYAGMERVRSAGELVVGLDQNNLPFSTAHPEPAGLDYDIAKLLADRLGVSLRVYWAYSSHDSYPSKLATKKFCDVILGVMSDDRFSKRVIYSKPYYMASYRLVVRADDEVASDIEPLGDEPLAVEPGVAVRDIDHRNIKTYRNLETVLKAVASGEVKSGYVISSRGPWLAATRWPGLLKFVSATNSDDQFPICAAVRKTDGTLKEAIDAAFHKLAESGRLAEVFTRWNVHTDSLYQEEETSK